MQALSVDDHTRQSPIFFSSRLFCAPPLIDSTVGVKRSEAAMESLHRGGAQY